MIAVCRVMSLVLGIEVNKKTKSLLSFCLHSMVGSFFDSVLFFAKNTKPIWHHIDNHFSVTDLIYSKHGHLFKKIITDGLLYWDDHWTIINMRYTVSLYEARMELAVLFSFFFLLTNNVYFQSSWLNWGVLWQLLNGTRLNDLYREWPLSLG